MLNEHTIDKAQNHQDFSEVNKPLDILNRPFEVQTEHKEHPDFPTNWGKKLEISRTFKQPMNVSY